MKKIILLLLILINLFLLNITKETTKTISLAVSENVFDIYKLKTVLSTKNVLDYMNNKTKIIAIFPKVKSNYHNDVKSYYYTFTLATNQSNIHLFVNEYRNLLNKYNYVKDANLINFNGVNIDRIVLYTDEYNLERLLSTNKFSLE